MIGGSNNGNLQEIEKDVIIYRLQGPSFFTVSRVREIGCFSVFRPLYVFSP